MGLSFSDFWKGSLDPFNLTKIRGDNANWQDAFKSPPGSYVDDRELGESGLDPNDPATSGGIGSDIRDWLSGYTSAITDPKINEALLGAEDKYRSRWNKLGLKDAEESTFGVDGQAGTLSMLERMMPQISKMQAQASTAQRTADIGDIEALGGRATAALRASDPQRQALIGKQEAMTNRLYGMAERVTPEQQRMAQQQARESGMARGRGFGQSTIAAEMLGREDILARRRQEAQQSGSQLFGMYQQTTADPFQAILGRPGMAWSGAQQQQAYGGGMAQSMMGPQLYDPNAGINIGLQQQSNMMNYNAALAGAGASKDAGQMQMFGALGGAAIGAVALI